MALGEKIPEVRIVVAREKTADRRAFQKVIAALPQAGQVATPLIIAVIGGWYNCANSKQHDYQTAVQILNQRESSELASRSAAFEKPMATLLDKSHKIDDRILTLETFLYNFHGIVNARNLLTDLEQELEHSNEPSRGRSKRLRAIARGIANAQRAMIAAAMPREITAACNGDHSPVSLAVAAEANCTIRYSRAWYRYSDQHALKIRVECVGTHEGLEESCPDPPQPISEFSTSARIKLTVDGKEPLEFELSEFGSPFSDNTTIDHGHRIAILLRSTSVKESRLEVIAFPEDLVPPGYQPTITNISRLLGGESG